MASSINVTALPDYVNAHKDELFVKSVAGAKTLDYVEIMGNVKYKDALEYLDSEVVLADGSQCGWNPQGSDTFSERYIEVKPVAIQKELCWKDFIKKFANYQLQIEAGRETLPFEEKIAESNMNAIKEAVDVLCWQGDDTLGIDGFIAQAEDEDAVAKVELEEGYDPFDAMANIIAAIPTKALAKGVNVFMSYTDFRRYVATSNGECCVNRPVIDAAADSAKYVGDSRITIVPVLGLEGTNAIVAASKDALVYGTDIEGSEGKYRLFFDEKTSMFCLDVLFNAGTAIKFVDEVVLAKQA